VPTLALKRGLAFRAPRAADPTTRCIDLPGPAHLVSSKSDLATPTDLPQQRNKTSSAPPTLRQPILHLRASMIGIVDLPVLAAVAYEAIGKVSTCLTFWALPRTNDLRPYFRFEPPCAPPCAHIWKNCCIQ